MRKSFRVILDGDDVLFCCNSYALEKLNEEIGTKYKLDDITTWEDTGALIDRRKIYFNQPEFVKSQPVYEGAREFVEQLQKVAEVFICTSVPSHCAGERVSSIIRNFPDIDPSNILIGNRKDLLNADILLDDAYHNLEKAQVRYPVLFRRPWNHNITGLTSISNYDEFLTLVGLIKTTHDISEKDLHENRVVSLVGPSGSGKTTIANQLIAKDICCQVCSYTTRKKRNSDDKYHFISKEDFLKKKTEGFFFETSSYMGEHYGTSKNSINEILDKGKNPLLILDINGAIAMKQEYGSAALTVFVERNKEDCIRSIIMRALPIDETVKRISSLNAEIKNEEFCDITVLNNDINEAVQTIMEEL